METKYIEKRMNVPKVPQFEVGVYSFRSVLYLNTRGFQIPFELYKQQMKEKVVEEEKKVRNYDFGHYVSER